MSRRPLPAVAGALMLSAPHMVSCPKGDGRIDGEVTVVSQERGIFALFSFEANDVLRDGAGAPLAVSDPSTVEGWDIAISQWVLATASGDSAWEGSVSRGALLAVEGATDGWADLEAFSATCAELAAADGTENESAFGCSGTTPTVDDGYVLDVVDDPDGAGPFPSVPHNESLSFWFEYVFATHEVVPYGNVYVVEAADGRCAKIQFTDYYDEAGDSGFVSFSWAWLP
jgi:hypothetical protein